MHSRYTPHLVGSLVAGHLSQLMRTVLLCSFGCVELPAFACRIRVPAFRSGYVSCTRFRQRQHGARCGGYSDWLSCVRLVYYPAMVTPPTSTSNLNRHRQCVH